MEDELYNIPELDPKELEAARKVAEKDQKDENSAGRDTFRLGDIPRQTPETDRNV